MVIFSKVRLGVSPEVNALATIIVLVVTTGILLSGWALLGQEKRRKRDMQIAAAANL
jgi:putrescine transport system permease protein